jgi:hypothetical protein
MNIGEINNMNINLSSFKFGTPQKSGVMTVVPIFANKAGNETRYTPPLSGLKLSEVRGYGNMELSNPSENGISIVPLHMGYIQDRAQNHALCRSGFIAGGQKLMFEDACCVQAAQGGYLTESEQWFFILPLQLRYKALKLEGKKDYSKLWGAISELNNEFGLENRGHLEQILSRKRAYLNQYQSRFELIQNQTGAMFLIQDKLVGIEIAPTANYFKELWMALVCFCYGVAAMYQEKDFKQQDLPTFKASNLKELRQELQLSRQQSHKEIGIYIQQSPQEDFKIDKEESFLNLKLKTFDGKHFAGQFVEEDSELVYASLFAKTGC